ncbi:MAG: glycoside hydrolase family 5 protein [Chitinispirillaceae bacterium]|nr:glycoside hydrolase family 5 protein [Chitinispirillaceae bacterium]
MLAGMCTGVSATAPKHGWLQTRQSYILNERGNIVQLRGMSFFWSRPDWYQGTGMGSFYSADMVGFLADTWHCTVVRAAYDRNDGNNNGWNEVQTVIDAAIEKGLYVIIDWHAHDANEHESDAITFFTEQARKYLQTHNVIFEIFNEPIVAGDAVENDGSVDNARLTWAAIKPYLTNVTRAIRSTGSRNLVIIGTPYYCQHVGVAAADPVTDNGVPFENIAYAFHFYSASHGPYAFYVDRDGGGMEASYLAAGINTIPVFVSEWGTSHSDGGLANPEIDKTNTDWWFDNYINKYHLSWCNWSVSNWQASSAFAAGSITEPSPSGQIVKEHLADTPDEWEPAWVGGLSGPAGDTVFSMPAPFHQASSYNRYYGAHVEAASVDYLYRDKADRRIPGAFDYSVLKVTPGSDDNWVRYQFDIATATRFLLLRCHTKEGSGTVEVYLDETKTGQASLAADSTWQYAGVPCTTTPGPHTLKLKFVNTTGSSYLIEWLELTDDSTAVISGSGRSPGHRSALPIITPVRGGMRITLPPQHGYSGVTVTGIDGRTALTRVLSTVQKETVVRGLAGGCWVVRFEGPNQSECTVVVPEGP